MVPGLARQGHAFEQNQMGMASTLAIGRDYNDKEALRWFEKAAQRGYAPAQVNLAVMYLKGWGTSANGGAKLHWILTAAESGICVCLLQPWDSLSSRPRCAPGLWRGISLVPNGRLDKFQLLLREIRECGI